MNALDLAVHNLKVGDEGVLVNFGCGGSKCFDQRTADVSTRGVSAGVKNASVRVRGFHAQSEGGALLVEVNAKANQVVDALRAFFAEHLNCWFEAVVGTRRKGVLYVLAD